MATLSLRLYKAKMDKNITSLEIVTLFYVKGNEMILLDMRELFKVQRLVDGENTIHMPFSWQARKVNTNDLEQCMFPNGDINWDHKLLVPYPGFGKDQNWAIELKVVGDKITIAGSEVHGFEFQSYTVKSTRTNREPSNRSPITGLNSHLLGVWHG